MWPFKKKDLRPTIHNPGAPVRPSRWKTVASVLVGLSLFGGAGAGATAYWGELSSAFLKSATEIVEGADSSKFVISEQLAAKLNEALK